MDSPARTPSRRARLGRLALWSAAVTAGIPVAWMALTALFGQGIGWMGVLPMLLLAPAGAVVTLGLVVAWACSKDDRPPDSPPTADRGDGGPAA